MKYAARHEVIVPQYHQVPTDDGRGTRSVKVADVKAWVDVEIDIDAIVRKLGVRAATNSGGKSSALGGYIKIKRATRLR